MLTVLYFARLRETLGLEREEIQLPAEVENVRALTAWLRQRGESWLALDLAGPLRCAVNQELASAETAVKDGDEVAYFPPVTGG